MSLAVRWQPASGGPTRRELAPSFSIEKVQKARVAERVRVRDKLRKKISWATPENVDGPDGRLRPSANALMDAWMDDGAACEACEPQVASAAIEQKMTCKYMRVSQQQRRQEQGRESV
jgi:hypothetical protein